MNRGQKRRPRQLGSGGAPTPKTSRCAASVAESVNADNNDRARLRALLDEIEAARELRMSRTSFRRLRSAGLIEPVRMPLNLRRNLYARDDVLRLADEIAAGSHASAV